MHLVLIVLEQERLSLDNAVAEATLKVVKMEFAFKKIFTSFEELKYELFDYVNVREKNVLKKVDNPL